MYSEAIYILSPQGERVCIYVKCDDQYLYVPLDPNNTDYKNVMALVAEGKLTIASAE
jgi:hypothetical protein